MVSEYMKFAKRFLVCLQWPTLLQIYQSGANKTPCSVCSLHIHTQLLQNTLHTVCYCQFPYSWQSSTLCFPTSSPFHKRIFYLLGVLIPPEMHPSHLVFLNKCGFMFDLCLNCFMPWKCICCPGLGITISLSEV